MATKKSTQKRRRTLRLLPATVTMLTLLFIIKVNEVYIGSKQLREVYGVRDAVAEDKKEGEAKHDEKKAEAKKEGEKAADPVKKEGEAAKEGEAKKEEAGHSEEKPKEGEAAKEGEAKHDEAKKEGEPAKEGDVKEGEAKKEEGGHGEAKKEEGGHGEGKKEKEPEEPKTYGTGKSTVKEIEALKSRDAQPRFSKTELDLLENLSKRREELDGRERDLELKSKVLDATEKQINDKINEMKTLEAELSKVVAQYNEKQDNQIKSLVKIYESMKPDEAAAIFNEMEMPILLEVIGKMSERKVAPVLANMSPKKAKDVTQELAEKRKKSAAAASAVGGAGAVKKP